MVSFLGASQTQPRGRLSACRPFHGKGTAQPSCPGLPGQVPALQLLKQNFPQNLDITHTEDYSWPHKYRKIEADNTLDFQQIKKYTCLNSNKTPIPIYLLPFLQDPEIFLRLTSVFHSIGDLFSATQVQSLLLNHPPSVALTPTVTTSPFLKQLLRNLF